MLKSKMAGADNTWMGSMVRQNGWLTKQDGDKLQRAANKTNKVLMLVLC